MPICVNVPTSSHITLPLGKMNRNLSCENLATLYNLDQCSAELHWPVVSSQSVSIGSLLSVAMFSPLYYENVTDFASFYKPL